MGNIDEKRLSALLERIGNIKTELEALEKEVRGLGEVTEPAEVTSAPEATDAVSEHKTTVTEPAEVTEPEEAFDIQTPIDIDLQGIDMPSVLEDPIVEYAAASMVSEPQTTSSATEDIPVTEPVEATEPAEASEPVEASTETLAATSAVTEHVEVIAHSEVPINQPDDDLPFEDDLPADEPSTIPESDAKPIQEQTLDIEPEIDLKPTPEPEPEAKPQAAILDTQKAETAVMDVMAEKQAWRTDRPGSEVKNVISAISLNDRVLLINVLFKEDPILFQNTISAFNGMSKLEEAITYVHVNFPEWDMNSEPVYRLMMAVRRKLR